MKNALKLTVVGIILLCTTPAFAQQPKFGYINLQEIVTLMPERTQAQEQIKKLNDDYANMLETMQVELNNKYQDYQKNAATYTEAIRQTKERELQDLDKRINELYQTAQQELDSTSNNLLAPIIKKAEDAVKKVGRDNGYFIIFDESTRPMAYYDANTLTNVLSLVKKELGIAE